MSDQSPSLAALPSLSSDKPNVHDETVRRVERGSRIVTSVTHDMRLILQVSRAALVNNSPTFCPMREQSNSVVLLVKQVMTTF